MIGFSLVVEAFHIHVPKGYLYAAIAFSVLVEAFNQVAFRRTRQRALAQGRKLRGRVADAIVSMLGAGAGGPAQTVEEVAALAQASGRARLFQDTERDMVRAVLHLAERSVQTVMRPREQVVWLDPDDSPQRLRERILATGYERYPLARGSLDALVGVGRAVPLLSALERKQRIEPGDYAAPVLLTPGESVLQALERFRQRGEHLGIVRDERNTVRGVVSATDLLEAIAGDLPEAHDTPARRQDTAAQAAGTPASRP
jgi:CBS domain containing-hemolysin-like protein